MIKFKWETEFKQTEIGEVPREWEVRKVGDIIKIKYGKGLPSKNRKEGNVPVFGSSGVVGYHNSFVAKGPGLIIGRKGNIGSVYLSKTNFFPIDTVFYAEEVNDAHFMYYLLSQVNLQQLMSDSAVPGLNINFLKNVFIPYPPSPEQTRIATVLSWFDDLIENKKRQNEILEKVAMAIFKSWFVDFEPFKNEEFVYSEELGKEIPKGWEVEELGEFVSTQYGFTASGEETGKIKLLRIKDINKAFVIDWDSVPFCNIINDIFPKYQLKNMDIVISRIGDIGKVAIIENPPLSVFASYLIRLKIKNHKLTPYYLYYWLKAPDYQEYIQGAAEGSTRPNTNAEVIKAGPILIPPPSLIEKFEGVVFPIRSKIILNQKQIMVLRKIRDALLPKLVFGKLRVMEI